MLITFDVDGTLWCGGPPDGPGPITKGIFEEYIIRGSNQYAFVGNTARVPESFKTKQQAKPPVYVSRPTFMKDYGNSPELVALGKAVFILAAHATTNQNIGKVTHVGDKPADKNAAEMAGVLYMTPEGFVNWIRGTGWIE